MDIYEGIYLIVLFIGLVGLVTYDLRKDGDPLVIFIVGMGIMMWPMTAFCVVVAAVIYYPALFINKIIDFYKKGE